MEVIGLELLVAFLKGTDCHVAVWDLTSPGEPSGCLHGLPASAELTPLLSSIPCPQPFKVLLDPKILEEVWKGWRKDLRVVSKAPRSWLRPRTWR